MDGRIFAFATCTRIKWEATVDEMAEMEGRTREEVLSDWQDDPDFDGQYIRLEECMEERGWVNHNWYSTVLHDSRDDVDPIVSVDLDNVEDLRDEITSAFEWLGAFEDKGNGTFYALDSYGPFNDPWTYSYAIHFTRKYHNGTKCVEESWHPLENGFTAS